MSYSSALENDIAPMQVLAPYHRTINVNDQIMHLYLHQLLSAITAPGDDSNYGSAAVYDVLCLQALSKRIHYGKLVAEAKFRAETEKYTQLIQDQDADGIMQALTVKSVEMKVRPVAHRFADAHTYAYFKCNYTDTTAAISCLDSFPCAEC